VSRSLTAEPGGVSADEQAGPGQRQPGRRHGRREVDPSGETAPDVLTDESIDRRIAKAKAQDLFPAHHSRLGGGEADEGLWYLLTWMHLQTLAANRHLVQGCAQANFSRTLFAW
jgi:hypothetical protein